jgi:hypothetical protein
MTAKEFREYAEEHFGWAKTARSAKERQTFLQMAQAWLEAADMWEAVNGIAPTSFPRSAEHLAPRELSEPDASQDLSGPLAG